MGLAHWHRRIFSDRRGGDSLARRRRSSTLLIFAYFLIYNVLTVSSNSLRDQLVIVISRDDVRAGRFEATLSNINRLIESDENIRRYEERVEATFHGYDTHPDEVFEIAEVRNFFTNSTKGFRTGFTF